MAVAVAIIGYIRGALVVSLVLALSMVSVVMIGSVIGMSLPFVLNKLGFDPPTASAPLITSISDASGVLIYLFIASRFWLSAKTRLIDVIITTNTDNNDKGNYV